MSLYKEIGGYFDLEARGDSCRLDGVALNSGRNALIYIVRAYQIKKIGVPHYTCPVIWEALEREGVTIEFYHVDSSLRPQLEHLSVDDYIIVNNYFGVCGKMIEELSQYFSKLIVDDAQSLYANRCAFAHFNSPRKFFGLPDGGFAHCKQTISTQLLHDSSVARCSHLLIRADSDATSGYADFKANDNSLNDAPLLLMSKLTQQMVKSLDYEKAAKIRLTNFQHLHQAFSEINELQIDLHAADIPMVYPLLTRQDGLREHLIANNIYVAQYWPNIESRAASDAELYLQQFLLPLPIDQRYGKIEMNTIIETLWKKLSL